MKSYSIKLGEVNCQMLLLMLKNKGGELAIGFGNVKVIGNCVSSGFGGPWKLVPQPRHIKLETQVGAQQSSLKSLPGDPNCVKTLSNTVLVHLVL